MSKSALESVPAKLALGSRQIIAGRLLVLCQARIVPDRVRGSSSRKCGSLRLQPTALCLATWGIEPFAPRRQPTRIPNPIRAKPQTVTRPLSFLRATIAGERSRELNRELLLRRHRLRAALRQPRSRLRWKL